MHAVAERLADDLSAGVLLNEPARSIEVAAERSVLVRTATHSIHAQHVIVAVPPTAYATVTFTPPLPEATVHAASGFSAGSVMKFLVRYDQPFWRDQDSGATRVWMEPSGLYVGEAGLDEHTPMLVAFLGGPSSHIWREMAAEQRRRALMERLVEAYGPRAASPTSFVERDWAADDWGGGGYWNVLLDPSITDAVDVLLQGAQGVTFASTELAAKFPGYIEGAINAGRVAASGVSELLAPDRSASA
jgi:monoamine oxidase